MLRFLANRVESFTLRVTSFAFRVRGFAVRVEAFTARVKAFTVRMESSTLRVKDFTVGVHRFVLGVEDFTIRAEGFVLRMDRFVERTGLRLSCVDWHRRFLVEASCGFLSCSRSDKNDPRNHTKPLEPKPLLREFRGSFCFKGRDSVLIKVRKPCHHGDTENTEKPPWDLKLGLHLSHPNCFCLIR
jgi:hypothetical protein